ncbi:uncharacterized protein ATNIH1004_009169 [Aspergillus tanneri]|uniref:EKC/KEOPS complex subunit BUD32 n=1 Tax=Aspergillus tanneri TaxID=1220188 RepID=A0A5M9MDD5_9EURO|nr:uncharacterized protein ATNIH1004_009169 [Aspergillus tanneri]KAA8644958.1 hypothetical protein ATNIH1004_009169 [Aspergillus tanneri]
MDTSKSLASPIELPHRSTPPGFLTGETIDTVQKGSGFVQYGHPYAALDRFFVGLKPQWSGINAIEFTENSPVTYVKKFRKAEANVRVNYLKATSHRNLVNLREVFVTDDSIFFVYERWGISLKEICQLWPVFQLGEVEVATLCNEILNGLKYIHDELGVSHGDLREENIFIMENGDVRIGNIGESMVRVPKPQGKDKDLQAVCNIVQCLLGLDKAESAGGTMRLLAGDFAGAPCSATIDELLQVCF